MKLAFGSTVISEVSDFEHAVAQIPDMELLQATGLVLRLDAQLWLYLMSDEGLASNLLADQAKAVARRAPNLNVFAIPDGHSAASARPTYVARHPPRLLFRGSDSTAPFSPVDAPELTALRAQDLAQFIERERTRCVICTAPNFHFALPSGAHSSQFLRLGEAFVDILTVDRIAYWVALDIESTVQPLAGTGRHALLVDHPSMLVLAARVQMLVSLELEVVTFPTYPSDIEARTATFSLLEQLAVRCSSLRVLIGVASTGRLARFVQSWAKGVRTVEVMSTVLYAVQDLEDLQPLCRLSLPGYKHFATQEECELCASQSEAVAIHASNYMVGYAPAESVALPQKHFETQRLFIERWGAVPGVLRTHYDDPNESTARHHAFYIDIGTLLEQQAFKDELSSAVLELETSPDVIAIPDHPTAKIIGEFLSSASGIPLVILDSALLTNGIGSVNADLLAAKCLLVLDDVFITGSRLDVINRFLRENKATRAPALSTIHFMTPLATPASEGKYTERRRGLVGNHGWTATLTHLYSFPLPDWHSVETCPWCREQAVLSRLARLATEFDGTLSDRISRLDNKKDGLTDDAYFMITQQAQLPALGAESVLLSQGATPLQVLFSCASAVQQLRHAAPKPLNPSQFPAPAYLAERVLSVNFTERIIWLAVLRSLRSSELSAELREFLRRNALDRSDGQHSLLHAELVVAWLTGKLDALDTTAAGRQLFQDVGIPWAALFESAFVDQQD